MTQPIVVLLSGWAGSGKDAAAALMIEEMGFSRAAFADALKEDVAWRTNMPHSLFCEHHLKDRSLAEPCALYPTAKTPRDLLLQHAAHMRQADPDVYSRSVVATISGIYYPRIVISDWRYQREYDYICKELRSAKILCCRITRPGIEPSDHPTEHDLDAFPMDIIIKNDGCISSLRDSLKNVLRPFLHGLTGHFNQDGSYIS